MSLFGPRTFLAVVSSARRRVLDQALPIGDCGITLALELLLLLELGCAGSAFFRYALVQFREFTFVTGELVGAAVLAVPLRRNACAFAQQRVLLCFADTSVASQNRDPAVVGSCDVVHRTKGLTEKASAVIVATLRFARSELGLRSGFGGLQCCWIVDGWRRSPNIACLTLPVDNVVLAL
ncbi:MAG: hypothetical protein ACK4IT_03025 [Thioalkalivibrionaceae bacterium]